MQWPTLIDAWTNGTRWIYADELHTLPDGDYDIIEEELRLRVRGQRVERRTVYKIQLVHGRPKDG